MTTMSTHVLDAARGLPAAGLPVTLFDLDSVLAQAVTDEDGRIRFEGELRPGVHRLSFATGPWFGEAGRSTFYPTVDLTVQVVDGQHHHVALLLSPFSYTTYRGS